MSLHSTILESFSRSFGLYRDFVDIIDESVLNAKLPGIRSNTVGLQLWCVVGARESFSRAIEENEWGGFSCSLTSTTSKEPVFQSLTDSAAAVEGILRKFETFSDTQNRLIIDLLEHEAGHQGQLIRYLYGLQLPIPESWKSRFNLS